MYNLASLPDAVTKQLVPRNKKGIKVTYSLHVSVNNFYKKYMFLKKKQTRRSKK